MSSRPLTLADQFAQLKNQRSLLVGLLFLLVIVVFWIGIGLFSSQKKFAVPKAMRDLAKPLSPILDEETLGNIEKKRSFSEAELSEFTIYKVVVNEVSKQLRLVDIAYQETPASQSAAPKQPAVLAPEPTAAATASAAVTEAPTASASAENQNGAVP
jgi:hypothetical protein